MVGPKYALDGPLTHAWPLPGQIEAEIMRFGSFEAIFDDFGFHRRYVNLTRSLLVAKYGPSLGRVSISGALAAGQTRQGHVLADWPRIHSVSRPEVEIMRFVSF